MSNAELYGAISRAIGRSDAVGKDATNTFHRYKYASAEALIAEARAAMAAEQLSAMLVSYTLEPKPDYYADLHATYLVAHSSGQSVECTAVTPVLVEKGRPQDKAVATALTYSLGYFLRGLLLLPRVDDEVDRRNDHKPEPDGDAAAEIAAISKCTTMDELRQKGGSFDTARMSTAAKERLRVAYEAQRSELLKKDKKP